VKSEAVVEEAAALTVRDFEAEKTDEEEGCYVGEIVALQVEVYGEAHDSSILDRDMA
jgi:hypothetical protein